MENKRGPRRSAGEWAEIVSAWKASGSSASQYGAENGLSAASLYSWRSRLSKGVREEKAESVRSRPQCDFAEVVVRDPVSAPSVMEVVTSTGHLVRVQGVVDAAALRALLQALESC